MSEQSPRDVEALDYRGTPPAPSAVLREPLTTAEWVWFGVLVVSCLVGFGMTIFAPT
jgi:hypothetical protein